MSLSIAEALLQGKLILNNDTAVLDVEILLAFSMQVNRAHLLAFPERLLTEEQQQTFTTLLHERAAGKPIAYITGRQEFWSLELLVTPDTLIPRADTELLVELLLEKCIGENKVIADLGTGSGAIALAIAKEQPTWEVHATDLSEKALEIAALNAQRLVIENIQFHAGAWCEALPQRMFDAIVSNPPYISPDDLHLLQPSLTFEPRSALVAEKHGLRDLEIIISNAKTYLKSGGCLMLEHGYQQALAVKSIFAKMDYTHIDSYQDLAGLDRVTIGVNGD